MFKELLYVITVVIIFILCMSSCKNGEINIGINSNMANISDEVETSNYNNPYQEINDIISQNLESIEQNQVNLISEKKDIDFFDSIIIYKISQDNFNTFLNGFSYKSLIGKDATKYEYSEATSYYVTSNATCFPIRQEFFNLWGNVDGVKRYLKNNNIEEPITKFIIFETSYNPITIYIETTNHNSFITIDEWDEYSYTFYNQEQFFNKYKAVNYKLNFKGEEIEEINSVKTYEKYSEFPVMALIKEDGGEINWLNEMEAEIKYKNKIFYLSLEKGFLYQDDKFSEKLIKKVGGFNVISKVHGNELYIDGDSLQYLFRMVGEKININIDRDNATIYIK